VTSGVGCVREMEHATTCNFFSDFCDVLSTEAFMLHGVTNGIMIVSHKSLLLSSHYLGICLDGL
jgi:hypothetical protein